MPTQYHLFVLSLRLRRMGTAVLLAGLLVVISLALLYWNVWAKASGSGAYGCGAITQTKVNNIDNTGEVATIMIMAPSGPPTGGTVTLNKSLTIQGGWQPNNAPAEDCGGFGANTIFPNLEAAKLFFTHTPLISPMPGPSLQVDLDSSDVVTIQQVRFQNNSYIWGNIRGGELRLENVIIENSNSSGWLSLSDGGRLVISNCQFISNDDSFSISAGGNSQVIINNSQFIDNGGGGATIDVQTGTITINNSLFANNQGTGLYIYDGYIVPGSGKIWLNNNVFQNNTGFDGGGLYISGRSTRQVYLINNLFAGNTATNNGGAIHIVGNMPVDMMYNTIANPTSPPPNNTQAGIYVNGGTGTVSIINTIIANYGVGLHWVSGSVVEDYNLYYGNNTHRSGVTKGVHTLDGLNPKFVNPDNSEYHLGPGSAALDIARPSSETTDFEGEPRPQLGGPDIGADERAPVLTETFKLLNGGGVLSVSHSIVALDGDTIVVGRPLEDTAAGTNAGAVYILRRSGAGWSQEARLTASDAAADDNFGADVAISGEMVIIGAPFEDGAGGAAFNSGAAYIFQRSGTTWNQQAKLVASDAAANDQFGSLVDISGDTMLIGATYDDVGAAVDAGSAYIFQRSGSQWGQNCAGAPLVCRGSQKLTAGDAAAGDRFGDAVAISGETAIIGALFNDVAGADSGSAYIFQRNGATWSQQAKLTAGDGAAGDRFGDAVDIEGETVAIGSYFDDGVGVNSGSVYIFQRSGAGWNQQAKLTASDGHHVDTFGNKMALSGDTLVITANAEDDAGIDSGAAYIFKRSGTTWSQQSKLVASDSATYELFGYRAAVSGERIVVGAVTDNNYNDPGQVYVFGPAGVPAGGSVYLPLVVKN